MNSGLKASGQGGVPAAPPFHNTLQGLAADDHLQYLLLAGRAGGQAAFGGTGAGETLDLQGTSNADLGLIRAMSAILIEDISAGFALQPYSIRYAATQTVPGVFVGGGFDLSPNVTITGIVFIWQGMRASPFIISGSAPFISAMNLIQTLPTLQAGSGGTFNPIDAILLNGGATHENTFSGTRTALQNTTINVTPVAKGSLSGAVMNVTNINGQVLQPQHSTVAGATVDLGFIRALWARNPIPQPMAPDAGTKTMVAYYGLDVEDISFGGTVPKAAVRSDIQLALNAWFLQNTGGADSDHGAGHVRFDDDAGVVFGSDLDLIVRWNSAEAALEYDTALGVDAALLLQQPNADKSWTYRSTVPIGLQYNVEQMSFGTAVAAPNLQNWFVIFQGIDGRQPGAGAGDYSDLLWLAGGDIDINGLAMTDVQAFRIDPPSILLSGGSIADLSDLFLNGMATAGGTRMQTLRVLGRSRMDGLLTHNEASLTQLTASVAQLTLPADNAGRFVLLQDADALGPWTIQGILNVQLGDAFYIVNDGADAFLLGHQDAAAAAADRIISPTGADLTLGPDEMAKLWYDPVATRWRILETTGA